MPSEIARCTESAVPERLARSIPSVSVVRAAVAVGLASTTGTASVSGSPEYETRYRMLRNRHQARRYHDPDSMSCNAEQPRGELCVAKMLRAWSANEIATIPSDWMHPRPHHPARRDRCRNSGARGDERRGTGEARAESDREPDQRAVPEQHQLQRRPAERHAEHPQHPAGHTVPCQRRLERHHPHHRSRHLAAGDDTVRRP